MRYLFITLITTLALFSANLSFEKGSVLAHTSVFGDSTINPSSSNIVSHLTMKKGDISTLKGSVEVSLTDLKSDNSERDEHMYEAIDTQKYTSTTYTIKSVSQNSAGSYNVEGSLTLHGITKKLPILATIATKGDHVTFKGKTSFKMSDFGITPPKLLFLTVRDLLEMKINTTYKVQ